MGEGSKRNKNGITKKIFDGDQQEKIGIRKRFQVNNARKRARACNIWRGYAMGDL